MLTNKLLAALGIAGALLLGVTTNAEAHGWRGPHFRPVPIYRAPVYRAPVYRPPVYGPVYQTPVYQTPVYGPVYRPVYVPAYRPVGWHHPGWGHQHGRRW